MAALVVARAARWTGAGTHGRSAGKPRSRGWIARRERTGSHGYRDDPTRGHRAGVGPNVTICGGGHTSIGRGERVVDGRQPNRDESAANRATHSHDNDNDNEHVLDDEDWGHFAGGLIDDIHIHIHVDVVRVERIWRYDQWL